MQGRLIIVESWNYEESWSLRLVYLAGLPPATRGRGGLYTMTLHFMTICEQNINIWLPQSVGALGVATIFGKMNGILVFVEALGGRRGFARMNRVVRAARVVFDTETQRHGGRQKNEGKKNGQAEADHPPVADGARTQRRTADDANGAEDHEGREGKNTKCTKSTKG